MAAKIFSLLFIASVSFASVSSASEAPFQIQADTHEVEGQLVLSNLRLDIRGEGTQELRVYNPQIPGYVRDALDFVCESFGASAVVDFKVPPRVPNTGRVYTLTKNSEGVQFKLVRAPMTTVISEVTCR